MTVGIRFWKLLGLLFTINFVASCALNTPYTAINDVKNTLSSEKSTVLSYQGRLSLRIASDPPQSLYAGFNLNGDAHKGNLSLNSPLGNSLAQLAWTPQSAVLIANNEAKEYPSTSALIEHVIGTVIPLNALFDWMAGKNTPADGWEIDLSGMTSSNVSNETVVQRLVAKRLSPLPTAELRIAIDK